MGLLDFINYMKSKKTEKKESQAVKKLVAINNQRLALKKKIHQSEDSFHRYFSSVQPELYGALKRFINDIQLEYCKASFENQLLYRDKYIKNNKLRAKALTYRAKFNIIDELVKKSGKDDAQGLEAENKLQEFLEKEANPDLYAYHKNSRLMNSLQPRLSLINYNPDLDDAFFDAQLRVHDVFSKQSRYNAIVETYNNLLATYKKMFANFDEYAFKPIAKYETSIVEDPKFQLMQEVINSKLVEKEAERIVRNRLTNSNSQMGN